MKVIAQNEVEIRIANSTKPISNSNFYYPLNSLDDRIFEVLLYSIFTKRNENENSKFHAYCEDVILMQGVGEKGMDCVLSKDNKITGIIQCKKYSSNLSPVLILNELTKFALHFHLNRDKFIDKENFKYFFATSTGYSGKSLELKQKIKDKSFIKEFNFDEILSKTLKKYKEFKHLNAENLKEKIAEYISLFNYEFITPQRINIWINDYPVIIDTFFEIRKVTDNNLLKKQGEEIIAEIKSIKTDSSKEDISVFLDKYYKVAKEKLDTINFIGFDLHKHRQKPTDITLSELYVKPNFKQRVFDKNKTITSLLNSNLTIANIFKSDKNIVILGDPGAGKSLLVKFIITNLINKKGSEIGLLKYEDYIPFRFTLRKYYEFRDKLSLIDYLSDVLSNQYQAKTSVDMLNFLLTQRKCLIFFDGLDEIFNVVHKNELKELIEAFAIAHPNAKCIVTSRFIGYHDIKFKSEKFDEFAIKKLDETQITELVTKFYTTQIKNLPRKNVAIENCLTQLRNDVDDELKSNPLILSLILILTSNNIVIPDSKLEIYESCTKTLVESIDSNEKELCFVIPVKNKRITFASLAYWQYESLSNGEKVSYEKTKKKLADFFIDRKEVLEFVEAEEKAIKFLEYAERRSIYFEDTFTHKTFLEYYTSDYLYINYFTKASDSSRKELLKIINKYLPNPFWFTVFELLFSRIDSEQADSEVMDDFLSKQLVSNSIDVYYFIICNIASYTNISENIKELAIKKTIQACIKGEKISQKIKKIRFEENSIISKINTLSKRDEYFDLVQKIIYGFEIELIEDNKKLVDFYNFYFELISLNSTADKKLQINEIKKVEDLSYTDHYLFSYYNFRDGIQNLNREILIKQIEYFGTKSLFNNLDFKFRENVSRINTFDLFLISIIDNQDIDSFNNTYAKLINYGITEDTVVKHIKSTKTYYYHRDKGFKNLLDSFIKSTNLTLDKIIIAIIETMPDKRDDYQKFREANTNKKLKQIDDVFTKTSR